MNSDKQDMQSGGFIRHCKFSSFAFMDRVTYRDKQPCGSIEVSFLRIFVNCFWKTLADAS
jgi:hypothetical protein